ncbi:MAG: nucleotidyltransferase [Terriglobales bacterium]
MNPDLIALLSALSARDVRFVIAGAHALAWHGVPRATGDVDVWVEPTPANAARLMRALSEFGAPLAGITADDFTRPGIVFQVGIAPVRLDILTDLTGLVFPEAWARAEPGELGGVSVRFLSRADLIRNKRATGRLRDLADVEQLEGD